MQITGQSQNTESLSGFKTRKMLLTFRLYANSANTLCTLPAFTNINVKCTLLRNNRNFEIMNDNLLNLGIAAQFRRGLEPMVNINFALPRLASPAVGGVVSSMILPIVIELPGIIDIAMSDKLTTEINVNGGAYSAAGSTLNITGCTLDSYWEPCDGHEQAIPKISCQYLQSSTGTANLSFGDHVKRIIVANYDKGLGTIPVYGTMLNINGTSAPLQSSDANQVITNLNFACSHFTQALSADRLNMQTLSKFESWVEAMFRGQIYEFEADHSSGLMDNVNLSFNMNAVNLTASNNVVTAFSFVMDSHTMERFHRSVANRTRYHQSNMAAKGIMPPGISSPKSMR